MNCRELKDRLQSAGITPQYSYPYRVIASKLSDYLREIADVQFGPEYEIDSIMENGGFASEFDDTVYDALLALQTSQKMIDFFRELKEHPVFQDKEDENEYLSDDYKWGYNDALLDVMKALISVLPKKK